MLPLFATTLVFLLRWDVVPGQHVKAPGCIYNDPYPLVFDAAKQPVGEVMSPFYEKGQYPNYAYCDYTIKAPPGYIIKLTFIDMDLEAYNRCGADKVYIMDGPSDKGEDLGVYCGYDPPPFPVVSTKNGMHLSFRTDHQIQKRGFRARYEAILPTDICPRGQYKCSNNRCYTAEQKCDGRDDCLDGSDEAGCNRPLPSYTCGISSIYPIELSDTGADRVVGGIEARPNSWPWQADMQMELYYPNSHQCGATLLNPQWVMTAAHCLSGGGLARYWRIHLGNHHKFKKDRYEQIRLVERIVLYPGYTGDEIIGKHINFDHDIALMKLNAPVEITEAVRPACLPPENYTEVVGTKCQATGWGETRGSGSNDALKQAEMFVQTEESCPSGRRQYSICLDSRRGLQGVCHGDSGGPLACKINDKWHVLGVASFVTRTNFMSGLCSVGGTMSVYNRVSNKISWINHMIEKFS